MVKHQVVYGLLPASECYFQIHCYIYTWQFRKKPKYFVGGIGVLSSINGISNNPGDNVFHFAI